MVSKKIESFGNRFDLHAGDARFLRSPSIVANDQILTDVAKHRGVMEAPGLVKLFGIHELCIKGWDLFRKNFSSQLSRMDRLPF